MRRRKDEHIVNDVHAHDHRRYQRAQSGCVH